MSELPTRPADAPTDPDGPEPGAEHPLVTLAQAFPPPAPPAPAPEGVDRRLLDAVVSVADGLELESTLRRIVRAASDLTNAPFAALGVLDEDGLHKAFVHTGVDAATVATIGRLPRGHGVFGHITRVGRAVRVSDLSRHPAFSGFPAGHPPMGSFLGVPVGIGERVVGNLYLAGKRGGFTVEDEDVVVALAAAAAVAVDNAGLYEDARRRERWVAAAQEVTTAMLSGSEEDEALNLIARRAREVAGACASALVLPGWDGSWVLEIVDSTEEYRSEVNELIGTVMPAKGRAVSVMRTGRGLRVAELSSEPAMLVPALRAFGPALYAPLTAGQDQGGVLILLRRVGQRQFTDNDLATAQAFATQAALALQLAVARRQSEEVELLEERARIARDLHDLVVQELFAMGMRLGKLRGEVTPTAMAEIDSSLDSLDRAVRQIRATIRSLRDPDAFQGLTERLQGEADRALGSLGFQPELVLDPAEDLDTKVDDDLADDLVAVVREGLSNVARHARARSVTVTVRVAAGRVTAQVRDDGVGVPDRSARRSGLGNLSERARRHGGSFTIEAAPDGGSLLQWQAPLG